MASIAQSGRAGIGLATPALWLRRWATCAIASLSLASGAARAALPDVGTVLGEWVEVRVAKRLPLPPGRWRVTTAFEEPVRLDYTTNTGMQSIRSSTLVLLNEEPEADLPVLILEYTSSARVNWQGQPCDTPTPGNTPLATNKLGTTSNTVRVRCNRIWPASLRGPVQRVAENPNPWFVKRFEKLRTQAPQFPVHGLLGTGYLSTNNGDRVIVNAYANPGRHGLDDERARVSPFRNLEAPGEGNEARREYLKAFVDWLDAYTNAIDNAYLAGSSPGPQTGPAFRHGQQVPGVAAAPTLVPVAPAPPPQGSAPQGAVVQPSPSTAPAPAPVVAATPRQKVHALVIGNSAYSAARLVNPRNDAQAVAERFRRFGFEVSTVLDATRRQMVEALARFSDSARDADVSIVFYAGHGVQVNGVNYLIPVDMDLADARAVGVAYGALSLNTLLESHLPGKAKLVFLDACRDNPLARSLAGTRGSGQGLAAANAASGTLISYATRDGSTAADGAGANSPYTSALLAHLDEAEDISIILRRVRQRVMTSTKGAQEPWEYGSLIGDKLVLSQIARPR